MDGMKSTTVPDRSFLPIILVLGIAAINLACYTDGRIGEAQTRCLGRTMHDTYQDLTNG